MKKSLNIPALKTAQAVGLPKSQAFAEGLGMTFKDGKTFESTAIGSNDSSPLQLAGHMQPLVMVGTTINRTS